MANDFEKFMQALVYGIGRGGQSYAQARNYREEQEREEAERRRRAEEWERMFALQKQREARLAEAAERNFALDMTDRGYFQTRPGEQGPMPEGTQSFEGWQRIPETVSELFRLPSGMEIPKDSPYYGQYAVAREQMPGGSLYQQPVPSTTATGLKPIDWDRFQDNARQMVYAKYGIADGMSPPDIDWPSVNAEIQSLANELAAPFLNAGAGVPDDIGSPGEVYMELAAGLRSGDPAVRAEAEADFASMQANDPPSAMIVSMLLQSLPEESASQPSSLGFVPELAIALAGSGARLPQASWPGLEDLWRRGQRRFPGSGGGAR